MGSKLSCMEDCNGNKNINGGTIQDGPTRWQDIASNATPEKNVCIKTMITMNISSELLEIENKINELIAKNNPNEENTRELKRLIEFKELKTIEFNNCNVNPRQSYV